MIGGIYNPKTKMVTLANAGHLPAIQHHKEGSFDLHESLSLPLGILPDQQFEETSFSLAQSSLYLYTDGLSEGLGKVQNSSDEILGLQILIEQFKDLPRQQRLEHFANEASIDDYNFDDLTILLLEESD
jgi:serine phosphatase RsbU (regulator of sigma subunit)